MPRPQHTSLRHLPQLLFLLLVTQTAAVHTRFGASPLPQVLCRRRVLHVAGGCAVDAVARSLPANADADRVATDSISTQAPAPSDSTAPFIKLSVKEVVDKEPEEEAKPKVALRTPDPKPAAPLKDPKPAAVLLSELETRIGQPVTKGAAPMDRIRVLESALEVRSGGDRSIRGRLADLMAKAQEEGF